MFNNFIDTLKDLIMNTTVENINTCLPGIVESYDASKKRAKITPAISKQFQNSKNIDYKPVVNVPIIFPRTKNTCITFPLEQGDKVLMFFSQRAIGNFLDNGKSVNPENNNTFNISDAFAFPCISFDNDISGDDPEALEICHHNERITIKKDGEIQLGKDSLKKLVNETFLDLFNGHVHYSGNETIPLSGYTYINPSGAPTPVTGTSGAPTVTSDGTHLTSIVKAK